MQCIPLGVVKPCSFGALASELDFAKVGWLTAVVTHPGSKETRRGETGPCPEEGPESGLTPRLDEDAL